jgi:hypothetical protein
VTPGASSAARARLLTAARSVRGPAIVLVVYLIARAGFVALGEGGGLLTPSGGVNPGVALLGLLVLTLRLVVLFVLPPVITYRLLTHLLTHPLTREEKRPLVRENTP